MKEPMDMNDEDYMKKWLCLNQKMADEHFTWGISESKTDYEQYMSFNLCKLSKQQWNDIQEATRKIGHILNKTYHIVADHPALQQKLGLPTELMDVSKIPSQLFSYFCRLDLIVNNGKIKVIEANTDTPTGYLETSVGNRMICEDQGYPSPNHLEEAIYRAWRRIEKEYEMTDSDTVYFTSYDWHDEDRETTLFTMRHSGLPHTKYIPLSEIIVAEDGLYDEDGKKMEYLYRLYPLEYFPDDKDENGKRIGNLFLHHVAAGNVKIVNPPSAFLMQSKAIMALIWRFYSDRRLDLFTKAELQDISRYFIPTYLDNTIFVTKCMSFVEKPILGREGGGVAIYDEFGCMDEEDPEHWYAQWPKVYQQYEEMPDFTLDTWTGPYTGKLLFGSFLIGGEPSGLFLRVGDKITGNLSMFCGVTVQS